jgi:methylase of polypeptide subunit release factors
LNDLKTVTRSKAQGAHYTPPDLARFLAQVAWKYFLPTADPVRVLDPACGDGALLRAVAEIAPRSVRSHLVLVGYETDPLALARAAHSLVTVQAGEVALHPVDFLSLDGIGLERCSTEPSLFTDELGPKPSTPQFDMIIANPPYVRTQVLGSQKAQALAQRFRLNGRVDLYQAFVKAMAGVLRPHGILGLLTSNRFLFVQSGADVRQILTTQFDLKAIYDLGDTKLFEASVLPAIVVAAKGPGGPTRPCSFHRVYEARTATRGTGTASRCDSVLDSLRNGIAGVLSTPKGRFLIERGILAPPNDHRSPWCLQTEENRLWLDMVRAHQACTFGEVARIRVGIKTTADRVFIRDDWDTLPMDQQPETSLLRPIITHCDAVRWTLPPHGLGSRRVLYPHQVRNGKREPISLESYPAARRYLEAHRAALMRRTYVLKARRQWYEIWVPQDPDGWSQPKIVFPDISEAPRFFVDRSGAVVDGDCYWMTLKPGQNSQWLYLMLAVANSSFALQYYDTLFHNQLYSGRRRFMTQYVKEFPLPPLNAPAARRAIQLVAGIVEEPPDATARLAQEAAIDAAVWESFGLSEDIYCQQGASQSERNDRCDPRHQRPRSCVPKVARVPRSTVNSGSPPAGWGGWPAT